MWINHLIVLAAIVAAAAALAIGANAITPPEKLRVLFALPGLTVTSHVLQWLALGIGVYGVFSWAQTLRLRDAPTHALIWRSPAMVPLLAAGSLQMIMAYGLTAWAPFYAVGKYNLPLSEVGLKMGAVAFAAGIVGTYLGGVLADLARKYSPRGRLYVSMFGQLAPVPLVPVMLAADSLDMLLAWWMLVGTLMTMWFAGTASTALELVLPRMRGTAAATHTLCLTMIGLGCGPYFAGLISDVTGDLFTGIVSVYAVAPAMAACMIAAIVALPRAETTALARAQAAGEPVPA
jgi:MFS family permease